MKRNKIDGIPITDPRVKPILQKAVERYLKALERCGYNPDYLLAKTYCKTTM